MESLCMCFNISTSSNYFDLFYQVFSATCWNTIYLKSFDELKDRNKYLDIAVTEKYVLKSILLGILFNDSNERQRLLSKIVNNMLKLCFDRERIEYSNCRKFFHAANDVYQFIKNKITVNGTSFFINIGHTDALINALNELHDLYKIIDDYEANFIQAFQDGMNTNQDMLNTSNEENIEEFMYKYLEMCHNSAITSLNEYNINEEISKIKTKTDDIIKMRILELENVHYQTEQTSDNEAVEQRKTSAIETINELATRLNDAYNKTQEDTLGIDFTEMKKSENVHKVMLMTYYLIHGQFKNILDNSDLHSIREYCGIDWLKTFNEGINQAFERNINITAIDFEQIKYLFKFIRIFYEQQTSVSLITDPRVEEVVGKFIDLLKTNDIFNEYEQISLSDFLTFDFLSIFNLYYNCNLLTDEIVKQKLFGDHCMCLFDHGMNSINNWSEAANAALIFRNAYEKIHNPNFVLKHLSLVFTIDTYPAHVLLTEERKNICCMLLTRMKNYVQNVLNRTTSAGVKIDCFIYHSNKNVKGSIIRNVVLQAVPDHFLVYHDDDDKARSIFGILNIISDVTMNSKYRQKINNPAYPVISTVSDKWLCGPWSYIALRNTWMQNDYYYTPFFMCGEDACLARVMHDDPRYKNINDRYSWVDDLHVLDNIPKYGISYLYLLASNRYNGVSHEQQQQYQTVWQQDTIDKKEQLDADEIYPYDHHIDEIVPIHIIDAESRDEREQNFWATPRVHRKTKLTDVLNFVDFNSKLKTKPFKFYGGMKTMLDLFVKILIMLSIVIIISVVIKYICVCMIKHSIGDQHLQIT